MDKYVAERWHYEGFEAVIGGTDGHTMDDDTQLPGITRRERRWATSICTLRSPSNWLPRSTNGYHCEVAVRLNLEALAAYFDRNLGDGPEGL